MPHQTTDLLSFDGSCHPNPGGTIRAGAVIVRADGSRRDVQDEIPPNRANTVNTAEYHGLIIGLRAYVADGGAGPLTIQGDSQIVIRQLDGQYHARGHLARCCADAWRIIQTANLDTTFVWVPRDANSAADLLTHDPATRLPPPDERTVLVSAHAAPISEPLRRAIRRLNRHAAPGFRDFANLRVGGRDALSGQSLAALQQTIRVSHGTAAAAVLEQVQAACADARGQAAILRWCLRGLAVELALRKQQVDAEITANANRSHERVRR